MRKDISIILFVLSILFLNRKEACPASIDIHFPDTVVVTGKVIKLKDIAHIEGTRNLQLIEKLGNIKIGTSAPPGFSRFVNTNNIIQYDIIPEFKKLKINLTGAERVKVITDKLSGIIGDFESVIYKFLKERIKWEKDNYSIKIQNREEEWRCYKAEYSVEIQDIKSPFPKGNLRLDLKIKQEEELFSIPVICRIKVAIPVVCAVKTIHRGDIISEGDISLFKKDITVLRNTPLTESSYLIGKTANKTISEGTIIFNRYIKAEYHVHKGDIVKIIMKNSRIKVSVKARARENGRIGDMIWVENLQTHKLIYVEIIDKGVVIPGKGERI